MKFFWLTGIFLLLCHLGSSQQPKILIEGHYQGQNIYVQNPFSNNGGFCTQKVLVNGVETKDSIHSSAYEIDLRNYGFKVDDPVKIEIYHLPDCKPHVLQPMQTPRKIFQFKQVYIDSTETLHWSIDKHLNLGFFIVQSFQWNKWITIGEVVIDSIQSDQDVHFLVKSHSGINKIRVISNKIYSAPVEWKSKQLSIDYSYLIEKNEILFSDSTRYEMYDSRGNIVKMGRAKSCNVKNLIRGKYFLHYDNIEETVVIGEASKRKKKKRFSVQ